MISSGASLPEVLEDVCRCIEEHAPDLLASVLLADPETRLLWPAAGSRIPGALTRTINPLPIAPEFGSSGSAKFPMSPMVVTDIATDPLFGGTRVVAYRETALRHGLRAVWFYPLLSDEQVVLGSLALYCTGLRPPNRGDLDLIAGARQIALLAIEKSGAQAALNRALEEIRTSRPPNGELVDPRAEESLQDENQAIREEIDGSSMFEQIVGSSGPLKRVLALVAKVAQSDSTVLITGETGTGKELLARAIHKTSKRSERAFVRVNCAAIPPSLIASELFGHEKGAFTGALHRRLGRFELANGGTLFLDEVGELPAETQVALLRVLQEREFERVGGSQLIQVDVRVLAATNRDLKAALLGGEFRRDLYYRLNVFPMHLPPLRERADDIPLLAEYLVHRYASKAGKRIRRIEKRTLDLFRKYDWPGNVRELQNVIERAVVLSDEDVFSIDESWIESDPRPAMNSSLSGSLAQREREMIEAALIDCQGRVSGPKGAARKLGILRQTLESRIRALGINKNLFKPS